VKLSISYLRAECLSEHLLAGDDGADQRGTAGGLQHGACQQQSCRDGTRQLYDPPSPRAYGERAKLAAPGNIRSVKEQADRGAEQSAKSGLLGKDQSAGETPAECSEFQASEH